MAVLPDSTIRPLGIDTDTESILGTLRRRWWIIPAIFAAVGGLVLLEDPETSIQPSYSRVDRDYQVMDNSVALALLDLPNDLLSPIPSLDTQLAQLPTSAEFKELSDTFPGASLLVRRSSPQIALQAEEGGEGIVTLRGRTAPLLSLTCTESTPSLCPVALDSLADLVSARHEAALRNGLRELSTATKELQASANKSTVLQERLEAVNFGLQALESQELTKLVFIREFNAEEPETTVTESPNYRFALAAAVILSFLTILQWSVFDKRLYGLRRIARTVGGDRLIGHVRRTSDDADITACAAALRKAYGTFANTNVVRLGGVSDEVINVVLEQANIATSTVSFSDLDIRALSDASSGWLIVAQRGASHARELLRASDALAMSSGMRPRVLLVG